MAENPKFTRTAADTLVLVRISGDNYAADDTHLYIGKGDDGHSNWLTRAQIRFNEPSWPDKGRIIDAWMTTRESGTNAHSDWKGPNSRLWIKRLGERPGFSVPDTADGHVTQQGSGDKFPGSAVAGDEIEWSINGTDTHKVTAMIERMLPPRIKKRDGSPGDNQPWNGFQIRSSDEGSSARSFILSRDITLVIALKTTVTPDPPEIVEVIGAQDVGDDPTVVASTDGRTLAVVFGFRGAPGDTCSKAELELRVASATDPDPSAEPPVAVTGAIIKSTGSVPVTRTGAAGQYLITLNNIPIGSEGRYRIRTTSQKGDTGDWTSLEENDAHVRLAVQPGPPLNIVFQPYVENPHIQFNLNSPNPDDVIASGDAEVTLLPQGTAIPLVHQEFGIGRRADLETNHTFVESQEVSYRVRANTEDALGAWSPVLRQTLHESQDPTFAPDPGRLTSRTPTLTESSPTADGYRLRLLDPVDDEREIYDITAPVVNQTSHAFDIPAGTLTWGQRFRAVGSYLPDAAATYLEESDPLPYSIAGLPVTSLSVPDAVNRRVSVEDVEWQRTVTDPDGAAISAIEQEIRVADTPQGSGTLVTRRLDLTAAPLTTVDSGEVPFETSVDSRARAANDVDDLLSTTLSGAHSAGDSTPTLASSTGVTVGMTLQFASAVSGETETGEVASLGPITLVEPLQFAHSSGAVVKGRAFGPWSPWLTITALQPPDVDLLSPVDDAVIVDPTDTFAWSTTGFGGRTQASAQVTIYDSAGVLVAVLDVDADQEVDIPAFLLDDASDYTWAVIATDTLGMETTSATRSFSTTFAEPIAINSVIAEPDANGAGMVVSWDIGEEPYPHNVEVTWISDDGSPVRIDGGPEILFDGNEPFTGASLLHIGARLGPNTYYVSVSNGWRSSEPVSTSATLLVNEPAFPWVAVAGDGEVVPLSVTSAAMPHAPIIERMQPPGGSPRQITWGMGARSWSLTIEVIPAEDREVVSGLRGWASRGAGFWLKSPSGYRLDPLWVALQSFTPTPSQYGIMPISLELAELGDPVHAILPPEEEPTEGIPDGFVNIDVDDFGLVILEA